MPSSRRNIELIYYKFLREAKMHMCKFIRGLTFKKRFIIAIILLIATIAIITCDRPLARGDGLAYFIWLDSIAGDGDMDLSNQAQIFAHVNMYQVQWNQQTGRWISVFPYGSALLLSPAYWIGRFVNSRGWLSINVDYFVAHQGRPLAYSLFPMFAVNLYALATIFLSYLSAQRYAPPLPSAASALFLFLGMPIFYYTTVEPFASHVPSAFLVAVTLYLMLLWDRNQYSYLAFMAGLAGGLATLTRWQTALTVWVLAWLFLRRRSYKAIILFALGFWILAWHVLYTWNWMFGRPLFLAYTESGFIGLPRYVLEVLFAGNRGLFIWSPLTLLALIGLILLGRQDRTLAIILGAAFVIQTLMNAALADWYGGWGFGMRRKIELYPVFVIGLSSILAWIQPNWLRKTMWILSVIFLILSLLLFVSHLNFINTVRPYGDEAWVELGHQLFRSSIWITRQVFLEHYGPWAWSRPGP